MTSRKCDSLTAAGWSRRGDGPNIVSSAALVPVLRLARDAGLDVLADRLLSVATDKGANAGGKVTALVAGMVAGGGLHRRTWRCCATAGWAGCCVPSTLGSFLRSCTFGHVRQLDAVAARLLAGLATRTGLVGDIDEGAGAGRRRRHGHRSARACRAGLWVRLQRGSRAQHAAATVTTSGPPGGRRATAAEGSANLARGAQRLVADPLASIRSLRSPNASGRVLLRANSAFYGHPTIGAAVRAAA